MFRSRVRPGPRTPAPFSLRLGKGSNGVSWKRFGSQQVRGVPARPALGAKLPSAEPQRAAQRGRADEPRGDRRGGAPVGRRRPRHLCAQGGHPNGARKDVAWVEAWGARKDVGWVGVRVVAVGAQRGRGPKVVPHPAPQLTPTPTPTPQLTPTSTPQPTPQPTPKRFFDPEPKCLAPNHS